MRKEEIAEILADWNFWGKELNSGIKRDEYTDKAISFLKTSMIVTITGIRRAGKSFILRQIARSLIDKGVEPKDTLIINFEDKRLGGASVKLLDQIFNVYTEYANPKSIPYVFIDEVHLAEGWERWARTYNELQKAKIIVSGSTSELISKKLGTTLTGRHLDIKVFPLGFKEFLKFKNCAVSSELDIISKKEEIRKMFAEYFKYGGFPEVILAETKTDILISYFEDILTKDIIRRFGIKKINKMEYLAKFYLSHIGNYTTFRALSRSIKLSKDTIEKYSWYLENAVLIFFIKRFSFSLKEQENSPRKIYSLDAGLSNALGFKFSENSGRIMENIAAIELKRKASQNPLIEIYYWKDYSGKEVDFVVKEGMEVKELIQVTYASSKEDIEKRETNSLLKAMEEMKLKEGLVLTDDYEAEEAHSGKKIKFIPLWKWLLEGKLK